MKAAIITLMTLICSAALAQNPPVEPATSGDSGTDETLATNPQHGKENAGAIKTHNHHEEAEEKRAQDNKALFPKKQADLSRGTAPATVKLSGPAYHATVPAGTVGLSWEASPGADAYHVQVATDPNFKWLKADDHFVKTTKFDASGLEAGHKYYWRVAPWKSDNVAGTNKGAFTASAFETK